MPLAHYGELPWPELEEFARDCPRVVLPLGAVEPYGPHLPLCTDGLVAEWVATAVAKRTGGVVAPLLPVGNSSLFLDFPGTLSVSDQTLGELVRGVGRGFLSAGFSELLVINGHAGNSLVIASYLNEVRKEFRMLIQVDVWRLLEALGQDLFAGVAGAFGHAGPCATSLVLAIAPKLVRTPKLANMDIVTPRWLPGVSSPIPFRTLYPQGYAGDVSQASSEKGALLLDRLVNYVVSLLQVEES